MFKNPINLMILLLFSLSFFGTATHAQESGATVQDMIQQCEQNDRKFLYCVGVGSGVSVMMMLNSDAPGTLRICNSGRITNGQIIRIFLNWANRNPQKWGAPAPIGFALSLQETYPCT